MFDDTVISGFHFEMAPLHDYDLRATSSTHSYEVADDIKPLAVKFEDDQLVVPHEDGNVTLDKLKEFVFDDEDEAEDPEYSEESSGESDDSLEYESENETPRREYDLRAPAIDHSYEVVHDLEPVTVKFEWDQLIVPHEEGDVTLEKLKEFVFEDDDDDEDPEYEYAVSSAESEASLDYEFQSETEVESAEDDASELESAEEEEDGVDSLVNVTSDVAFATVVTNSCFDLVDNEDINWSPAKKAEEYIASFGVSQFGIRLVDTGLSAVEMPISLVSTWIAGSVRSTRRHLRAARRAGEKQNGDCCKSRSLLVHMTKLFPLNVVLETLGVGLVEETVKLDATYEDIDDPEYVLSSDESEDSIEFRSEIESEDLDSDVGFEITCSSEEESSDVEEVISE